MCGFQSTFNFSTFNFLILDASSSASRQRGRVVGVNAGIVYNGVGVTTCIIVHDHRILCRDLLIYDLLKGTQGFSDEAAFLHIMHSYRR